MTKLDYSKTNKSDTAFLNDPYWNNPKTGFDKAWHIEQANKKIRSEKEKKALGTHVDHELERILAPTGPHAGKIICKTCGNKFVTWLSKKSIT
jgi:hypothetical protein